MATSGETVTVALKHPNGLILRLFKMEDVQEAVMGGGTRTIKKAMPYGGSVRIKGYNPRNSKIPLPAAAGAFALTYNVPKDFWDEWVKQNSDHPYLTGNLLYAVGARRDAEAMSRERDKDLNSGLEPLNPDRLPTNKVTTLAKGED